MPSLTRDEFVEIARDHGGRAAIPVAERLLADQLTPVLAYRRMVADDERTDPSFLLESVEGGERQGRHSIMGAHPVIEVRATGLSVTTVHHRSGGDTEQSTDEDPLMSLRRLGGEITLLREPAERKGGALPACVLGGWFGYAGYDTVRYAEPEKLDPGERPDRRPRAGRPAVRVLRRCRRLRSCRQARARRASSALLRPVTMPGTIYDETVARVEARIEQIQRHSKPLPAGRVDRPASVEPMPSNHDARRAPRDGRARQGVHPSRRHLPGRARGSASRRPATPIRSMCTARSAPSTRARTWSTCRRRGASSSRRARKSSAAFDARATLWSSPTARSPVRGSEAQRRKRTRRSRRSYSATRRSAPSTSCSWTSAATTWARSPTRAPSISTR